MRVVTVDTITCCGQGRFGSLGSLQEILKEVEVPIVDQKECQKVLRGTRLGRSEYFFSYVMASLTSELHTGDCTLQDTAQHRFFELDPSFMCAGGEQGDYSTLHCCLL